MVSRKLLVFLFLITGLIFSAVTSAQKMVVSGPWAGNIEIRDAVIWLEVSASVKSVAIKYYPQAGNPVTGAKTIMYKGELGKEFNPIKINLDGLLMNTTYSYSVIIDGKPVVFSYPLQFTTKDLWQWRKPAPDLTFLTGSCAYFNEPVFDRPGTPYGSDSIIFESMARVKADFNLWLGDNWYTREADYFSPWGLWYRASHDRATPILQRFMSSMPQYAIWDDHDFGPDNSGKDFILKDESRRIFLNYWNNPSYGENGNGIYTKISWSDVDIFMTDDRYFRSADNTPDSIDGLPNPDKIFFGKAQMDWLKNSIRFSKATFKIIAIGSQVLNPQTHEECMREYSKEYNEMLDFLRKEHITGVLFLTGDQHHSEIMKLERKGTYTLYDVTISSFTAGISKVKAEGLKNPSRVPGILIEEHNFGKITVTGNRNERVFTLNIISAKGDKLAEWSVGEKELQ